MPTKAYEGDAGFDLYANEDKVLVPGVMTKIRLGIAVCLPEGWCMVLCDKSGMRSKGLMVFGVVDCNYRGEVQAVVYNVGATETNHQYRTLVQITNGDKVCQGLILPVPEVKLIEADLLPDSVRGERGFGSSGMG